MIIAIATVMISTSVNCDIVTETASVVAEAPWTAVTEGSASSARLTSVVDLPAAGITDRRLVKPASPIARPAASLT